jgi:Ca2+-binding EF-hand superfamily protein
LAASLEAKGNINRHCLAEAFEELDDDHSGFISKVSKIRLFSQVIDPAHLPNLG